MPATTNPGPGPVLTAQDRADGLVAAGLLYGMTNDERAAVALELLIIAPAQTLAAIRNLEASLVLDPAAYARRGEERDLAARAEAGAGLHAVPDLPGDRVAWYTEPPF